MRLDAPVDALLAAEPPADDPPSVIRNLVDRLHERMYGHPPTPDDLPIDVEMAASFLGAEVAYADGGPAGSVRHDGDRYRVRVNAEASDGRVRFSVAHEIIHIPFLSATGATSRTDRETVRVDWSDQEELLCDIGAAQLLMPASAVQPMLPARPTIDDVDEVAKRCGTSLEASLRRTAQLCGLPGSAVVLEPKLKPAEVRALAAAEQQPQLLAGFETPTPRPRLRVAYAIDCGLFVPRDKSVADDCPLADIDSLGRVDFVGNSGLVPSGQHVSVSAVSAPLRRGDALVPRVLALVFEADAWRHAT